MRHPTMLERANALRHYRQKFTVLFGERLTSEQLNTKGSTAFPGLFSGGASVATAVASAFSANRASEMVFSSSNKAFSSLDAIPNPSVSAPIRRVIATLKYQARATPLPLEAQQPDFDLPSAHQVPRLEQNYESPVLDTQAQIQQLLERDPGNLSPQEVNQLLDAVTAEMARHQTSELGSQNPPAFQGKDAPQWVSPPLPPLEQRTIQADGDSPFAHQEQGAGAQNPNAELTPGAQPNPEDFNARTGQLNFKNLMAFNDLGADARPGEAAAPARLSSPAIPAPQTPGQVEAGMPTAMPVPRQAAEVPPTALPQEPTPAFRPEPEVLTPLQVPQVPSNQEVVWPDTQPETVVAPVANVAADLSDLTLKAPVSDVPNGVHPTQETAPQPQAAQEVAPSTPTPQAEPTRVNEVFPVDNTPAVPAEAPMAAPIPAESTPQVVDPPQAPQVQQAAQAQQALQTGQAPALLEDGLPPPSPLLDPLDPAFVPPAADAATLQRLQSTLPPVKSDTQLSLPRRPRPVPLLPPKAPEPEFEAPILPPDQARSFLDRLNTLIEQENNGTAEYRALTEQEILNWTPKTPAQSAAKAPASAAPQAPAPQTLAPQTPAPLTRDDQHVSAVNPTPAPASPTSAAPVPVTPQAAKPAPGVAPRATSDASQINEAPVRADELLAQATAPAPQGIPSAPSTSAPAAQAQGMPVESPTTSVPVESVPVETAPLEMVNAEPAQMEEVGQATPTAATPPNNVQPPANAAPLEDGLPPPSPLLDPLDPAFVPPAADAATLQRLQSTLPPVKSDTQLSLPRRPRPVPLLPPKAPEPEFEAPILPPDQARSFLDRLNTLIEQENNGTAEYRALTEQEILNWTPKNPAPVADTAAPTNEPTDIESAHSDGESGSVDPEGATPAAPVPAPTQAATNQSMPAPQTANPPAAPRPTNSAAQTGPQPGTPPAQDAQPSRRAVQARLANNQNAAPAAPSTAPTFAKTQEQPTAVPTPTLPETPAERGLDLSSAQRLPGIPFPPSAPTLTPLLPNRDEGNRETTPRSEVFQAEPPVAPTPQVRSLEPGRTAASANPAIPGIQRQPDSTPAPISPETLGPSGSPVNVQPQHQHLAQQAPALAVPGAQPVAAETATAETVTTEPDPRASQAQLLSPTVAPTQTEALESNLELAALERFTGDQTFTATPPQIRLIQPTESRPLTHPDVLAHPLNEAQVRPVPSAQPSALVQAHQATTSELAEPAKTTQGQFQARLPKAAGDAENVAESESRNTEGHSSEGRNLEVQEKSPTPYSPAAAERTALAPQELPGEEAPLSAQNKSERLAEVADVAASDDASSEASTALGQALSRIFDPQLSAEALLNQAMEINVDPRPEPITRSAPEVAPLSESTLLTPPTLVPAPGPEGLPGVAPTPQAQALMESPLAQPAPRPVEDLAAKAAPAPMPVPSALAAPSPALFPETAAATPVQQVMTETPAPVRLRATASAIQREGNDGPTSAPTIPTQANLPAPLAHPPLAQTATVSAPTPRLLTTELPAQSPAPAPLPSGPAQMTAQALLQRALSNPEAREPLPLTVRSQLAPMLGQDVQGVHLIRDAHAAAATAAAAADALAVGDAVLLSPGQDLASPRGLGLLAHELTHVLRERDPSFVPAIMRDSRRSRPAGPQLRAPQAASQAVPQVARMNEEALAEQVEGRVQHEIQSQQAQNTGSASRAALNTARSTIRDSARDAGRESWSDLPAPWEPMPYWEDSAGSGRSAGSSSGSAGRSNQVHASEYSSGVPSSSAPIPAAVQAAPVAQAASLGRSINLPSSSDSPAPKNKQDTASNNRRTERAPDLDKLAQQVYSVLKRRLLTELRRDR